MMNQNSKLLQNIFYVIIIGLFCVFISSCSSFKSKKSQVRYIPQPKQTFKYISKRVRHFDCIGHFIKLDVTPIEANTICISIYR